MLKSRSTRPPGGWQFTQPQIGWSIPHPEGLTFSAAVDKIIAKRVENPRFNLTTDLAAVEAELDNFTCARLRNDRHWCNTGSALSFPMPPPVRRQPVEEKGGAAGDGGRFLSNAFVGIKTWVEWFGDGRPVDKPLAEKRATICTVCPKNIKGNIVDRFTATAAKEILAIFSALHDLDLHTNRDADLHACSACDCPTRAKVWAPLEIIKKHITKESWNALDPKCWMLHESK